jgi:hypothetical protein
MSTKITQGSITNHRATYLGAHTHKPLKQVRPYCDILSIFLIPQFCLFLRHQTMDKVQKHNSFNLPV